MTWSDEDMSLLRGLVKAKQSIGEIAKTLGRTRSAVAGMMRRNGLPSQTGKVFSTKPINRKRKPEYKARDFLNERRQEAKVIQLSLVLRPPQPVTDDYGKWACQWPIGDPKAEDFRFCGDTRENGKPYCLSHCRVAYHKPGEKTGRPYLFQKQRPEAAE